MNVSKRGAPRIVLTVAAAAWFAAAPGGAQTGKTHQLKPTLSTVEVETVLHLVGRRA